MFGRLSFLPPLLIVSDPPRLVFCERWKVIQAGVRAASQPPTPDRAVRFRSAVQS